MLRLILVGVLVGMASSAWADRAPLTGEALRHELVGSLLKIDTPLGVAIPVRVSGDGLVTGEAGALASTLGSAHDRGRWWISNDRLCVKWFRWFDAQTRCVTVEHEGTKIYWKDEGGETGTATIIRSDPRPDEVGAPPLVEAGQPSTPPTSPPPSSELSVAATPAFDASHEDVRPLRFGLGMNASLASPPPAMESKVEEGPTTVPAELEPFPKKARVREMPSQVQVTIQRPKPTVTRMPSLRVVGVAMDDALIIRNGPSEYHASIGVIPPDGKGVQIVGACFDIWCPIRHHRSTGWVNRYYLAEENAAPGEQRRAGMKGPELEPIR